MTTSTRLEALKKELEKNPDDVFARYLVALEYVKLNQSAEAFNHFQVLLDKHPEYVATYYQYGAALEKAGRIDEAKEIFRLGIVVAGKTGDAHTRAELQQALDLIDE